MELVVDNFDSKATLQEAVTKGFPHVHHRVRDQLGSLFAKPFPEFLEASFLAPIDDVEEFGAPRTFRGAEHRPVGLAFTHADLIGSKDCQTIQGAFGLDFLHGVLVDVLDGVPVQRLQDAHRFVRHHFAQFRDERGQMAGYLRTTDCDEVQGFRTNAAFRAIDSVAFKAKKAQVLPQS